MSILLSKNLRIAAGFQFADSLNSTRRIAYQTEIPQPALWIKSLDGRETRKLLDIPIGSLLCPLSWHPNGKTLYHWDGGIYAIDVVSGKSQQIFRATVPQRIKYYMWHLKCSQNGEYVSFLLDEKQYYRRSLCRINCDGSDFQVVLASDDDKTIRDVYPQANGDQLLVQYDCWKAGKELWLTDNRGQNPMQMGAYRKELIDFALSPDGKFIAFCHLEEHKRRKTLRHLIRRLYPPPHRKFPLYLQPVDTQITRKLPYFGTDPSWSPDGKTIAFVNTSAELCLLDPFQESAQRLVWFEKEPRGEWPFGAGFEERPVWSDDGRFLWFRLTSWRRQSRPKDYEPPFGSGLVAKRGVWEHQHYVGVIDLQDKRIWVMHGFWSHAAWEPIGYN